MLNQGGSTWRKQNAQQFVAMWEPSTALATNSWVSLLLCLSIFSCILTGHTTAAWRHLRDAKLHDSKKFLALPCIQDSQILMVLLAGVDQISSQTSQSLQDQLRRSRGGALDIQVLQGAFSRRPEIRGTSNYYYVVILKNMFPTWEVAQNLMCLLTWGSG